MNRSDAGDINDVASTTASGEVIGRAIESLEHRTESRGTTKTLAELIGCVAGIEVWEDEDVCPAFDGALRGFAHGNVWNDGSVDL